MSLRPPCLAGPAPNFVLNLYYFLLEIIDNPETVCYTISIKSKGETLMKFYVINPITNTTLIYTDITKARIALDYLNFTESNWHMEIVAKE